MTPFRLLLLLTLCLPAWPGAASAQPVGTTDLADFAPNAGLYRRVLGSVGDGNFGVPVTGGYDVDRDGHNDYAIAAMVASPQGRSRAGVVFLVFGDGNASGTLDTLQTVPRILEIHGDQVQENLGSEIWMGDVTGDGYGDLILCRQNYSPGGTRIGAGAMTLLPSSPALRAMAEAGEILDLRAPPESLPIVTVYGALQTSRLCIWARNGDVTGDGIDDLLIGADRERSDGVSDAGALYLLRGGDWLETGQVVDLADFGTVAPGRIARVRPRAIFDQLTTTDYHLGATVQVADLDGNGRAEVIAAATLNRMGAVLSPAGGAGNGSGGTPDGTLFIAWDDNFGGDWLPAPDFVIGSGPGSHTIIDGAEDNEAFGEEILGGLDFDADGKADLFVGDLTADGWGGVGGRRNAGLGHIIYDAVSLKGLEFDLEPDAGNEPGPPQGFAMATFLGPISGAITGDTALQGDFNADGIDDVAFSSPHDDKARPNAGTLHILLGKNGRWPAFSDLAVANFPSAADVQIHEIYGAREGDILCYSGAAGDVTGDGVADLLINEMLGDGSVTEDVGNLLVIDANVLFNRVIFADGFESP